MAGWRTGWITDWLAGWLTEWLAGWMAGLLDGRLAVWLAGWLDGWMATDWLFGSITRKLDTKWFCVSQDKTIAKCNKTISKKSCVRKTIISPDVCG